ncbi:hypothetical protein Bca4012_091679 [Brassica carinata]|uniref:Peptidase A1 domain-containing protein n=2 Tax=Brassica oleracea TaxID=3712 RepID=A0A0D3DIM5_BRAOL|nr:PREDICTED: basic 7S globulin-like [Brassica oleracea var. oleracea]
MASSPFIFSALLLFTFSLSSSSSLAKQSPRPNALVLPITKDKTTLQYTTVINSGTSRDKPGTPLVAASLVFDLGGRHLWVETDTYYWSTSFQTSHCNSPMCYRAGSHGCSRCYSDYRPGCNADPCTLTFKNPVNGMVDTGDIASEVVFIQSTNGSNTGRVVKIPSLVFSLGTRDLLNGLANGTVGMAGMGRHPVIGLPSQFAKTFGFNRKFAVCLPSSSSGGRGVAFFGNGPYVFLPGIKISKLTTTPLLVNPVLVADPIVYEPFVYGEKSPEYYIGVTAIKINEKTVPINTRLLKINGTTGLGGTKLSTVNPYTVLETSIFKAVTSAFVREATARNITRVPSVKPFGPCFSTKNVVVTRLGYAVPEIQLVLQSKDVLWRIFGANSMVSVRSDVICLGFVDGGVNAETSVMIGGLQLEDNLIEIDLAKNTLGFSSTLLERQTNCANFNFTSTAIGWKII